MCIKIKERTILREGEINYDRKIKYRNSETEINVLTSDETLKWIWGEESQV